MVYHIKLFPVTSLISFLQKLRYLFLIGATLRIMELELGLTVFILFYLNEQIAELQGDGV